MSNLYNFINPNANDKISSLRGNDLIRFIYLLDSYHLEYRDRLNLDNDTTFGVEIEFEDARKKTIENLNKLGLNWALKSDRSLVNGIEINSPIMYDKAKYWRELKYICDVAIKGGKIYDNSGGHIHIGSQTLGENIFSCETFIATWLAYENIFYRFAYGEYLNNRPRILHYALPLNYFLDIDFNKINQGNSSGFIENIMECQPDRYTSVNFNNVKSLTKIEDKNTIEFRLPNGSLEPIIWQNNINVFTKLLESCKKNNIDLDIVKKRYKINKEKYNFKKGDFDLFRQIFIEQALELCDLLFDNNLDKLYFLRQYFKSMEISNNYNELDKAKVFVRKN